jgi:hypothetical protein
MGAPKCPNVALIAYTFEIGFIGIFVHRYGTVAAKHCVIPHNVPDPG